MVLQMRLIPFRELLYGLRRIAERCDGDKEVELVVEGEDVELDRTMLERLLEPLVHILRNAVDHGIENRSERRRKGKPEKGRICLTLKKEKDEVVIRICDDGRGIDVEDIKRKALAEGRLSERACAGLSEMEALQILFTPGFSLSEGVSETSGRGVGLDVVKAVVEGLGGSVRIRSEREKGTEVILHIPATAAIMRILLMVRKGMVFGVPLNRVGKVVEAKGTFIREGGHTTTYIEGRRIEVVDPGTLSSREDKEEGASLLVICQGMDGPLGLLAERIIGEIDGYVRDLPPLTGRLKGVLGYTFLEEDRPVFVIEPRTME